MGIKPWPSKPLDFISIDFLVDLPTPKREQTYPGYK